MVKSFSLSLITETRRLKAVAANKNKNNGGLSKRKARKRHCKNNSEQKNKRGRDHNKSNSKKKEKHNKISRGSSSTSNSNDAPKLLDHETIAVHLLSRLPVKSLMRFKSVCKRWCSFIEDDPDFIDLHLARSKARPGFSTIIPLSPESESIYKKDHQSGNKGDEVLLLSGALLCPKDRSERPAAVVTSTRRTKSIFYDEFLGPVDGLICFIDRSACSVQIYNVSTREVTPWIESAVITKEKIKRAADGDFRPYYCYGKLTYQFGFDPVTKEHKVVFQWAIKTETCMDDKVCEVLTVGDNAWRIVDEYPPLSVDDERGINVHANGPIYWYRSGDKLLGDSLEVFDTGSEKFRTVTIPDFIRDCITEVNKLELDAGIAILRASKDPYVTKIWIFGDHDKKGNGTTSTDFNTKKKKLWSNIMSTTIPLPLKDLLNLMDFDPITGTDQIIIEICTAPRDMSPRLYRVGQASTRTRRIDHTRVYSYNWKTNTMTEIDIRGILSSIPFEHDSCRKLWTTTVESLLPVRKKLQRPGTHLSQAK